MWNVHNGHVNYLIIRIMPILYLPYSIQHVRVAGKFGHFPPPAFINVMSAFFGQGVDGELGNDRCTDNPFFKI